MNGGELRHFVVTLFTVEEFLNGWDADCKSLMWIYLCMQTTDFLIAHLSQLFIYYHEKIVCNWKLDLLQLESDSRQTPSFCHIIAVTWQLIAVVADLVSVFEATTSSSLRMIAVSLVVPQSPTSFPSCYFRINIFTANPQLTGKLPLLGEKLGFGRMTTTFKNRLKASPSHDALVCPSLTSSINFNFNFYPHFDNNKNKMITT